jgi:hypothetical protein
MSLKILIIQNTKSPFNSPDVTSGAEEDFKSKAKALPTKSIFNSTFSKGETEEF